jgi:hypothetical protein
VREQEPEEHKEQRAKSRDAGRELYIQLTKDRTAENRACFCDFSTDKIAESRV